MNRTFYSLLFYLATPLLVLRLLWRSLRAPAYLARWRERFAFYSAAPVTTPLVFHAVSVGEVHAAVPLIQRLLESRPSLKVLVTTSTPTGSKRVTELLGDRVEHVYLPYDYPGAVKRFLHQYDPSLLVIMETELWPNLIHRCAVNGVRVVLANARLSQKSMDNYRKISDLVTAMLGQLECVSAQYPRDGERLKALGLSPEKLVVSGNMKYDMTLDEVQLQKGQSDREAMGPRPVIIAASTRTAESVVEDESVLEAFQSLQAANPDLLLVLVPRHPERFDSVFDLATRKGFSVARRSREKVASPQDNVLLGDSMGEMQYYFALADIAFVGGSLVPTGCQNIIEPAAMGLPVITGPSLFNFQTVSEQLLETGGMSVVENKKQLAATVSRLLGDNAARKAMGEAAKETVRTNQGATDRNLVLISGLLDATR